MFPSGRVVKTDLSCELRRVGGWEKLAEQACGLFRHFDHGGVAAPFQEGISALSPSMIRLTSSLLYAKLPA